MKILHKQKTFYIITFLLLALFSLGACVVPTPPPAPEEAPTADAQLAEELDESEAQIAMGKAIYDQNCASCHGIDGEGQPYWKQPGANGVYPAPPHDNTGHTWHHPDSQLLQIIAEGSSVPNSAMIGYADILTEEEMVASLEYIKTFWGEREAEMQRKATERADN